MGRGYAPRYTPPQQPTQLIMLDGSDLAAVGDLPRVVTQTLKYAPALAVVHLVSPTDKPQQAAAAWFRQAQVELPHHVRGFHRVGSVSNAFSPSELNLEPQALRREIDRITASNQISVLFADPMAISFARAALLDDESMLRDVEPGEIVLMRCPVAPRNGWGEISIAVSALSA